MNRFRVVLLATSLALVVGFAGFLAAGLGSNESLFRALGNLAEVVHLVQSEYVDELEPHMLALSLDAGILESLDPWAAVVSDDQVEAYARVFSTPPPYGLGLTERLGSAAVRYVFPGSPADDAGLDRWEVIEKIDGVYTRGRPLWHVALELAAKQDQGQPVTLTVIDRQVDERREVELRIRDWKAVHATADDVGAAEAERPVRVITLNSLTEGSADAVTELLETEAPKVLDLRGLVWGVEAEAIELADVFINSGTLAAWRGREAGSATVEATDGGAAELPTVVVDGETEWAGEILTAALQRAGAVVVGETTMGHAPHMRMVRDGELNLWIPVGRWLGADGEPIQDRGVEPDEPVATDDEGEDVGDPALERAIELARGASTEAV